MIVKIVDRKAGQFDETQAIRETLEEVIIPNVVSIRHSNGAADKSLLGDKPLIQTITKGIICHLSRGSRGFEARLKEKPGVKKAVQGEGRFIDWMTFHLTIGGENPHIEQYGFVTDCDVYLMSDQGETIEKYKVVHK